MQKTAVAGKTGMYAILELDRIPQLAERLQVNLQDPQGLMIAQTLSSMLTMELSPEASGIIISPEHNFHSIMEKAPACGLLLSLERRLPAYDPLALPPLLESWGPEHISNNYALAKLELYYHPQEEQAEKKRQMVAEIYDYCQHLGIDLLLKLRIYQPPAAAEPTSDSNTSGSNDAMLEAIEDLRRLADLLALEMPADPIAAVTITAELDVPWLFSPENFGYEQYKENLRAALESGAAGFLAGEVLWAEMPEPVAAEPGANVSYDAIQEYVKTIARDRLIELVRITEEHTQKSQPPEQADSV